MRKNSLLLGTALLLVAVTIGAIACDDDGDKKTTPTSTPAVARTITPSAGQTGTPEAGETGTPSAAETGTPAASETGTPTGG